MRKAEKHAKLEALGYRFEGYEYEWNAQRLRECLERKLGREVKLVRERSDMEHFSMWSVWTR